MDGQRWMVADGLSRMSAGRASRRVGWSAPTSRCECSWLCSLVSVWGSEFVRTPNVRRSLRGPNLAIGSLAVVVSPRVRAMGQLCLGTAFWNVFAILCISRGATRIYFSCYKGKRKFVSVGSWLAASRSFFRQTFSQFLLPRSKPASFEAARVS